jgi:hypothetical protein
MCRSMALFHLSDPIEKMIARPQPFGAQVSSQRNLKTAPSR